MTSQKKNPMSSLFDPIRIGDIALANRIVMAPLTRSRALAGNVPGPMTVEYYRQRASAGLIISEASQISPTAQGYIATPGIHSPEQIAGWKQVTDAVHEAGGKMVIQIWHVGRISHTSLQPGGVAPVSSTNRQSPATTFTAAGRERVSAPRALRDDELPGIVEDYRQAARNALAAGFDGVEIHAANTYLLEQFLRDSINDRSGPYGGSIANRARLVLEVAQAVAGEIGGGRTAIRLSPLTTFGGTAERDSDPQALYGYVAEHLAPLGLAYLHVIEGETGGPRQPPGTPFDYDAMRRAFGGPWMVNNGYTGDLASTVVAAGKADLVAFGKPFIGNPDLVRRLREGAPLNEADPNTFYGGGAEGYLDYPTLP